MVCRLQSGSASGGRSRMSGGGPIDHYTPAAAGRSLDPYHPNEQQLFTGASLAHHGGFY